MAGPDHDRRGNQDEVYPVFERTEEPDADRYRIDPGSPSAEHVLFVVLGVVVTILVFLRGLGFL